MVKSEADVNSGEDEELEDLAAYEKALEALSDESPAAIKNPSSAVAVEVDVVAPPNALTEVVLVTKDLLVQLLEATERAGEIIYGSGERQNFEINGAVGGLFGAVIRFLKQSIPDM